MSAPNFQSLSLYEVISLIVSATGFIAVAISLFLSRRQTQEMVQQSKHLAATLTGTVYFSMANAMFFVDEIFIRYPELRAYFYQSKEIDKSHPDFNRVRAIAELILDYFVTVLLQIKDFPSVYPESWWIEYITDMFANSPMLCRSLRDTQEWYISDILLLMEQGEARRATSQAALKSLTQ